MWTGFRTAPVAVPPRGATDGLAATVSICVTMVACSRFEHHPAMVRKTRSLVDDTEIQSQEVFDKAAEIFRVMSAPMRLRIISALCHGEKNVGELLAEIETTQPNMSQHLNTLYQAGVLGKRREGVQIYYRIINERVVTLCRAVCVQIASESHLPH